MDNKNVQIFLCTQLIWTYILLVALQSRMFEYYLLFIFKLNCTI